MSGIYDIEVKDNTGKTVSMSQYQGKVLLIVNTATGCGFTPQYEGLQKLYDKYHDAGFEVLDFPCNQFGNQAPGNDEEINDFCQVNYSTTFPRFAKIDVNGKNESPLYTYIKSEAKGALGSRVKWNFTKFLVDKDGKVIKRYASTDTPESIDKDIKNLLQ